MIYVLCAIIWIAMVGVKFANNYAWEIKESSFEKAFIALVYLAMHGFFIYATARLILECVK